MALVSADELTQRSHPAADLPEPSPLPALSKNTWLYLVEGPQPADGLQLWKVATDHLDCCSDLGWPGSTTEKGGEVALAPRPRNCGDTTTPLTARDVSGLGMYGPLSCYGGAEITVTDWMRCWRPQVDAFFELSGPVQSDIYCYTGPDSGSGSGYRVFGWPVSSLCALPHGPCETGKRYSLVGHFDDPTSAFCEWVPGYFGPHPLENPSHETAVLACRTQFVVTATTELE